MDEKYLSKRYINSLATTIPGESISSFCTGSITFGTDTFENFVLGKEKTGRVLIYSSVQDVLTSLFSDNAKTVNDAIANYNTALKDQSYTIGKDSDPTLSSVSYDIIREKTL